MSWLNRVRNALPFVAKKETADNLWHKCKSCHTLVFCKEWEDNLCVCPRCDRHDRIGAEQRFAHLFDTGSMTAIAMPAVREDPLKFRDSKKYSDRLKAARLATGDADAMRAAHGTIDDQSTVVAVQDFAFMGGSMGVAVGEAFIAAADEAIRRHCPFIMFSASGGARMQEGILSLMQMPRTTVALQRLKRARLPYIVVLTDPTSGGVMAAYAQLGDVQISEPKATLAFTGRRVIEQTIRAKLPDNFQTSEYYLDHGLIDMVVERKDLRGTLSSLIGYLAPVKAAA